MRSVAWPARSRPSGGICAGEEVLLGEGFWDGDPTLQAMSALGAAPGGLPDLPGLIEAARAAG